MDQKQITTEGTKSNYEQNLIGLYGFEKLTARPYYENNHDNARPKKINLYYFNGEHVGTWGDGMGWHYNKTNQGA